MTTPVSDDAMTEWCADEAHRRCPHWWSAPGEPKPDQEIVRLCQCSCHADCPLAVSATVHLSVWESECGCQGADTEETGTDAGRRGRGAGRSDAG
jgi:hypothetical protein